MTSVQLLAIQATWASSGMAGRVASTSLCKIAKPEAVLPLSRGFPRWRLQVRVCRAQSHRLRSRTAPGGRGRELQPGSETLSVPHRSLAVSFS